jgi:hypothetical protein
MEVAAKQVKKIVMTPDDFLSLVQESAWDRPSAYYGLCSYAKVKGEVPELPMHSKSRKYGWKGDTKEELAHIEKHFGIKNVPTLFNQNWDT